MTANVNASLLARNATRNLLALGVPLVVALASLPLLVDRLGTTGFGVLGIVWVFFGLFAELGLGKATTKYAAEAFATGNGSAARGVLRFGVLLQLAIGVVLALGLALGAGPLADRMAGAEGLAAQTHTTLLMVAATMPAIMVSAAYRGVLEAAHRFDLVNRVRIPLTSSTYLLPAVVLLAGAGLITMTAVLALARLIGTAFYALLAGHVLRGYDDQHSDNERATSRRVMLSFGAWQTANGLLAPLLVYLDRFLLGAIAGVGAVGLYTPAFEVATRMLILPAGVVMALFPAFSAWSGSDEGERSARMAARATLFIVAALAPPVIAVTGLGSDALTLWLTAEFGQETAVALGVLAAGALVNAAAFVPATLLQGVGRPDIPTRLYLVELPLYIVLMIVMITRWGIVGAAAAWSIRVTVDAVLLFMATHRIGALPVRELLGARVPQTLLGAVVIGLLPAALASSLSDVRLRLVLTAAAVLGTSSFLLIYALRAEGRARIAQALGLAST